MIMLAGINGAGKTTSIGKLAKYFQAQGKSVLLAAGDTFRAAAREQLQLGANATMVTVISQTTGDSAAVCSMPSKPPKRAASTSCLPTLPAACLRSFI